MTAMTAITAMAATESFVPTAAALQCRELLCQSELSDLHAKSLGLTSGRGPLENQCEPHVEVLDPTVEARTPFGRRTRYRVVGRAASGATFSSFKKHSDFVWLREQIAALVRGVVIPPLAELSKLGRFNTDFAEARRRQLQEFVTRILGNPELSRLPLVTQWLRRPETGMAHLRRETTSMAFCEQFALFQTVCPNVSVEENEHPNALRFETLKMQLPQYRGVLNEIDRLVRGLASLSVRSHGLQTAMVPTLCELTVRASVLRSERACPGDIAMAEAMMVNNVVKAEVDRQAGQPAAAFDALVCALKRMRERCAAMEEAVRGVTLLETRVQQLGLAIHAQHLELQKTQTLTKGKLLKTLFKRQNKEAQLFFIRQQIDALLEEQSVTQQWFFAARKLLVTREADNFAAATCTGLRKALARWGCQRAVCLKDSSNQWKDYAESVRTAAPSTAAATQSDIEDLCSALVVRRN